ncbi:T9SS type A sorting domain-containing protein [Lacinutrix sp.]|uniref:T9SS type A sorting domain-containing protein n=1 Tax=Lacinutrix sp. TaxID=1937692 RepID=UPI0025C517BD|nr:T9SS type A sorting domain-containing protein [Lacinutrix sp.]
MAESYTNRFELRFIDLSDNTSDEDDNTDADDNTADETNDEAETESDVEVISKIDTTINTEDAKIKLRFINNTKSIAINNPASLAITSVQVYSFTGQLKAQFNTIEKTNKTAIQASNLKAGHYIIVVNTNLGATSKKILVN